MKKPVFGSQETVIRHLQSPVPIVFDLTNESHVVPTDANGNNGNYSGCGTTVVVYAGAVDQTTSWTAAAVPSSGVTGMLSGYIYTVSNMTTDTGYVDITVSRAGYDSLTKRFSISKAKNGISYWINSSVNAIRKSQYGEYTPSTLSFSAICALASGSVSDYAGRFVISETTDGVNWIVKYTSTGDETGHTYTPNSGIMALKVQLFLAGGTVYKLDEEIIPVVSDGADGLPGADGADGADGINARTVNLTSDVLAFTYNTAGVSPSPSSATITANVLNTQGTVYYEFFKNDVSVQNTTSNSYTYTPQSNYTSMPDKIEVQIRENASTGTVLARDQITIIGMKAGSHGLSIVSSNEAHVVPSDNNGTVLDYSNSGTTIKVYEGSSALTYVTSLVNSSFVINSIDDSPVGKITIGTVSGSGTDSAVVGNHSNMDISTDLVVLTYNITAKRSDGLTVPLVVTQSIAKSKQGSNGVRAASIELYQWATSAPTTFPVGTSTYTWATGEFTDPPTMNGWTHVPGTGSAGQTLYGCRQVYTDSYTSPTSVITWAATSCYPLGAYGSNGTRTAVLEMYQWASSIPVTFPSGTSTYTWANGTFTAPSTPNEWSVSPTTAVAGQTLWACSVVYTDTDTTATSNVTWNTSTAYAIGAAGTNGTDGTDGVDAPRCLGLYPYSYISSITGMIDNDLTVIYSGTTSECGIYQYNGSWAKVTSPTPDQVSRCFVYILTAISTATTGRSDSIGNALATAYGVSADYVPNSTNFETLMVNFLYANVAYITNLLAQNITLDAKGYLKSSNYAESNGNPTAGFMLDAANQVIKAYGAKFVNITATGTLNDVTVDQLQPTFTHRVKWDIAGTYQWIVPAYVKWMRFTVRGAGGGGAGGMYLDACGTAGGNGGWTGISGAIHGVYLNAESGYGAPEARPFSAPGGAGGVSSNRDTSSDFIGGRNGGAGSSATNVGGQGGIPGGIIGLYNDIIERTNIAQSIYTIWLGVAATCPEHSDGYNGYLGNGGAGGCCENVKAGTTSGGGGGAGAIRQVTTKIDEIAGQALTITIGAGGAGGIGASGAHNGGHGGDGQVIIEW